MVLISSVVSSAAVARRIVGRRVGRASAGSDPSPGSDTLASCTGRSALRRPAAGRSTAVTRHLQHRLATSLPQLPGVHLSWLRACCLLHLQKLRDLIRQVVNEVSGSDLSTRHGSKQEGDRIEFESIVSLCLFERKEKKEKKESRFCTFSRSFDRESFDLPSIFFFSSSVSLDPLYRNKII